MRHKSRNKIFQIGLNLELSVWYLHAILRGLKNSNMLNRRLLVFQISTNVRIFFLILCDSFYVNKNFYYLPKLHPKPSLIVCPEKPLISFHGTNVIVLDTPNILFNRALYQKHLKETIFAWIVKVVDFEILKK